MGLKLINQSLVTSILPNFYLVKFWNFEPKYLNFESNSGKKLSIRTQGIAKTKCSLVRNSINPKVHQSIWIQRKTTGNTSFTGFPVILCWIFIEYNQKSSKFDENSAKINWKIQFQSFFAGFMVENNLLWSH